MKFLKSLFFILIKMHMWLPLIYSVVFILITASAGIFLTAWPYMFLGMTIAMIGSVGLVYFGKAVPPPEPPLPERREVIDKEACQPQEPKKAAFIDIEMPEKERREYKPDDYGERDANKNREAIEEAIRQLKADQSRLEERITKQESAPPHRPAPPPDGKPTIGNYYGHSDSPSQSLPSAQDTLYSPYASVSPDTRGYADTTGFSRYVQPPTGRPAAQFEPQQPAAEQPRIYRTRAEQNVLIYEYSNRFERHLVKTDGTTMLLGVEERR